MFDFDIFAYYKYLVNEWAKAFCSYQMIWWWLWKLKLEILNVETFLDLRFCMPKEHRIFKKFPKTRSGTQVGGLGPKRDKSGKN